MMILEVPRCSPRDRAGGSSGETLHRQVVFIILSSVVSELLS